MAAVENIALHVVISLVKMRTSLNSMAMNLLRKKGHSKFLLPNLHVIDDGGFPSQEIPI